MKNMENIGENLNNTQNAWQKMAEEAPPFSSKGRQAKTYIGTESGLEYVDPFSIDISTEQGKYEFLDTIVSNDRSETEAKIEKLRFNGEDSGEEFQDGQERIAFINTERKILERVDLDSEISVLDQLENMQRKITESLENPHVANKAKEAFWKQFDATQGLIVLLDWEMSERDPKYLNFDKINTDLESRIKYAERKVESSMADGFFGKDGLIHKTPGQKYRTIMTEDAELDLAEAKQDAETFKQLKTAYGRPTNGYFDRAIPKDAFASTIAAYISGHTASLDLINKELKTLDKSSQDYAEKTAERRKLAKERSSARRIRQRLFGVE